MRVIITKCCLRCAFLAGVCSAFLILASCGSDDLLVWLRPVYPEQRLPGSFVRMGHRWPVDADLAKSTTFIFSVLVEERICTHENVAGVPVPDSILFYPDGKTGDLPAIQIDLNTGRRDGGQGPWIHFELAYEYPDRRLRSPAMVVKYAGKVDLGRDVVDFTDFG